MRLATDPKPEGKAAALAKAADNADSASGGDPSVVECPLHNTTAPINVLLWRINELGGGFHLPAARPAYCMDAYASIIAAVKADVCVIAGIARNPGATVTATDDGFTYDPVVEDSGAAEAARLLAALKKKDPASAWAMALPKTDDGKIVYEHDRTTAILYKTSEGRLGKAFGTVGGSAEATLGVGQRLVWGSFSIPSKVGGPPALFDVIAPLGEPAQTGDAPLPAPTQDMPASFILALSALDDVVANGARLGDVRTALGAQHRPRPAQATVLAPPFWKSVWEETDALLDDFSSVNPADVRLQDDEMHWESIEAPDHPDEMDDVAGTLQDAIFVCNTDDPPRYRVVDVRAVDLIRASLSSDDLAALGDNGSPADEDGSVVAQFKEHRKAAGYLSDWSVDADSANRIAECHDFTALLSDHWPLVASITVHS